MTVNNIGVVGSGQMGSGIAQVAAQSGFGVCVFDAAPGAQTRAMTGIEKSLNKLFEKQKITEQPAAVLGRIKWASSLKNLCEMSPELVIEAASEKTEIKKQIFSELSQFAPPSTILASNTSSISITQIGAFTLRPEKVIGMHFMNPVPLMVLVEMIEGLATTKDTRETVEAVAKKMGKTVIVSKDQPGFVVNRILMPMINEACFALQEGLASKEDIDAGMKLGTNQPMGPLTLADFIGLDTCLSILEVLHEGLGDPKYRPCPLLRQYVTAGWLGKKSKRGFYSYDA